MCLPGPNVPVAAIQYRLGVLRKEGAALGLSESKSSSPVKVYTPKISKRVGMVSSGKGKGKGRMRGGMLSDDARYDEERATFGSSTDRSAAMMRLRTTPPPLIPARLHQQSARRLLAVASQRLVSPHVRLPKRTIKL